MSFWNRIQKFFPQTRNSLKAENLAAGLIEAVVSIGLLWGLQKWGLKPEEKEKTFKELHQPRTFSYNRNDDAPQELR